MQFVVVRQGRFVLIGECALSLGYFNISFLSCFTGWIFMTVWFEKKVVNHDGKTSVVLYAEQKKRDCHRDLLTMLHKKMHILQFFKIEGGGIPVARGDHGIFWFPEEITGRLGGFQNTLYELRHCRFCFCRQHPEHPGQAQRVQPAEAGGVPAAHRHQRQRHAAHEQHGHADHPRLRLQQRRHRAVLQCGGLRAAHRPQHGRPHRHPGLHHPAARWARPGPHGPSSLLRAARGSGVPGGAGTAQSCTVCSSTDGAAGLNPSGPKKQREQSPALK